MRDGAGWNDLWAAAAVFAILLGSAAFGVFVQRFLTDKHRSRETWELSQAVTQMLVTLTAVVLGLLTSSVVQSFNKAGTGLTALSIDLIRLDESLVEFGPAADPARAMMRAYAATFLIDFWPHEPRPAASDGALANWHPAGGPHPAIENEALGALLDRLGRAVHRLPVDDAIKATLVATASRQFDRLKEDRWKLIEEDGVAIPDPFYRVLVLWLVIVFLSLGLIAPRNALALALVGLGALAIASAVFTIKELDGPFTGLIVVSSASMRDALAHLEE